MRIPLSILHPLRILSLEQNTKYRRFRYDIAFAIFVIVYIAQPKVYFRTLPGEEKGAALDIFDTTGKKFLEIKSNGLLETEMIYYMKPTQITEDYVLTVDGCEITAEKLNDFSVIQQVLDYQE